jgi:ABC-type sugar transport system substrate-binding protein
MIGTTASLPEKYGEKIIPVLIRMMKGEQVPKAFYTDHVFLTRDNVKQYYPQ